MSTPPPPENRDLSLKKLGLATGTTSLCAAAGTRNKDVSMKHFVTEGTDITGLNLAPLPGFELISYHDSYWYQHYHGTPLGHIRVKCVFPEKEGRVGRKRYKKLHIHLYDYDGALLKTRVGYHDQWVMFGSDIWERGGENAPESLPDALDGIRSIGNTNFNRVYVVKVVDPETGASQSRWTEISQKEYPANGRWGGRNVRGYGHEWSWPFGKLQRTYISSVESHRATAAYFSAEDLSTYGVMLKHYHSAENAEVALTFDLPNTTDKNRTGSRFDKISERNANTTWAMEGGYGALSNQVGSKITISNNFTIPGQIHYGQLTATFNEAGADFNDHAKNYDKQLSMTVKLAGPDIPGMVGYIVGETPQVVSLPYHTNNNGSLLVAPRANPFYIPSGYYVTLYVSTDGGAEYSVVQTVTTTNLTPVTFSYLQSHGYADSHKYVLTVTDKDLADGTPSVTSTRKLPFVVPYGATTKIDLMPISSVDDDPSPR